jgi:hypothetical protein
MPSLVVTSLLPPADHFTPFDLSLLQLQPLGIKVAILRKTPTRMSFA